MQCRFIVLGRPPAIHIRRLAREVYGLTDIRRLGQGAVVVWATIFLSMPASADLFEWIDPVTGTFSDKANWNNTTGTAPPPPNVGDQLRFNEPGAYKVFFKQNEAADEFAVIAGSVTFLSDSTILRKLTIATGQRDGNISGGTLTVGSATNPVFLNLSSAVSSSILNVGSTAGNGTLTVTGSQSRVDALGTGSHNVGRNGSTGMLMLDSGATANYGGTLRLGVNTGSNGQVAVNGGGTLNAKHIAIATDTTSAVGSFTVTGAGSSVNQTTGATLTIGSASGGTGSLVVQSGNDFDTKGTFTSGTGNILINKTGTLEIMGGTFNANGNIIVDGGSLSQTSSLFSLPTLNLAAGLTVTAKNNAQVNFESFDYAINSGASWNIQSGADFVIDSNELFGPDTVLIIGGQTDGSLIVQGTGSSLNVGPTPDGFTGIGAAGTVTVRDNATANLGALGIGNSFFASAPGILNIEGGAQVTADTVSVSNGLSDDGNGTGEINIGSNTTTSKLTVGSGLRVGEQSSLAGGSGTINITNGGFLEVVDSFPIGTHVNKTGLIDINGGMLDIRDLIINGGEVRRQSGDLNIDPLSTAWIMNNGQLNLTGGFAITDRVTMIVDSGGTYSATTFTDIATTGDGTLIVDGPGSSATIGGGTDSFWGLNGNTAMVTLRNSATGSFGSGDIMTQNASTAIFEVQTGADLTFTGSTDINADGDAGSTGTLTVTGFGSTVTMSSSVTMNIGHASLGTATLNVFVGGTFTKNAGSINLHPTGTINLNGGRVNAAMIDHTGGGTFNFTGGTLNVGTFLGTLDQDGGALTPGASPGTTSVSGDYNLNAGSLTIEIGGLTPGTEHDMVSVTGAVNLGLTSVLDVFLVNAFTPLVGDSFDILDFGSITGNFATLNLPALGAGLDWDTSNLLIDGTLSVITASLVGDLDGDGFVGITDLNIVLGNWNQNVPPGDPLADPSGDGFVGIDDLNTVLGNWNAGTPPQASSSVPEPGMLGLSALGCLLLTARPRRSRIA
jgi:T5SS/PEP-CTERM-associated repeat protein